jgi:hypothetical protein
VPDNAGSSAMVVKSSLLAVLLAVDVADTAENPDK